jgi:transcriptional regulator with XRE-family HTH domain
MGWQERQAIGERLRTERVRRRWPRSAMAREIQAQLPDKQYPSIDVLISYIKRWETGVTGVSARYQLACAAAFGIEPNDLFGPPPGLHLPSPQASLPLAGPTSPGTVEDLGLGDGDEMERRRLLLLTALGLGAGAASSPVFAGLSPEGQERLAWAKSNPARVDTAAVDSLADLLACQRRAEDTLGSAAMVGPVTAQLAVVENMVIEARGPIRPAVVDVAQQWAQYAAWLYMGVRDFPAARHLWRRTLELAAEAGDVTMAATALTYQAEMATWVSDQPGPVIGLAKAAQRDPRTAGPQLAYSASIEARGHAMAGETAEAERKLAHATELASRPGESPPWLYWCTPQDIDGKRGIALGHLAEHGSTQGRPYHSRAVDALTACYAGLDAKVAQSEWGIAWLLHRAEVHASAQNVGDACADALSVAPVARQMNSVRLGKALAQLHTTLAARHPRDPRVRELTDALR